MGGNKGDKGRGKHFSSAKAAEALQSARGTGFGGISGSTPTSGFAFGASYIGQVAAVAPRAGASGVEPAATAAVRAGAIIPADLDGELSQQLQKLSKRDATTKLKALQALRVLAKEKPAADLQAALPSWAYLYGRLILDNNRAVRAEASNVSAALAAAVGRGIAPLLKSFVPSWWLAQSDGHGEAAAAARAAFAAAFPAAAKRREAVLFCRAEVLQLLADNLASTPQSLGDAKKESTEELQDRHERVLAATCTALASLIDLAEGGDGSGSGGASGTASQAEAAPRSAAEQELLDGVGEQLQQPAFYKAVLQSKAAAVRRQAYLLVSAAAARRPALLAPAVRAAAPAVLGALGDKEPGTHEALWAMLLAYARAFPASWHNINMQKAFLPRLLAFLRHGCYGSAFSSFPAVLPLVSLLPEEVLGPQPTFFTSLLEATWQGLSSLPATAKQGRQAAAQAFQDCLLYALLKANQLAAVNGGAEATGPAAEKVDDGEAAGQKYCSDLLQQALPAQLMPAVLGAPAEQAQAAEAAAVLAGVAGKLGQPSASSSSRQRLEQLLSVVGSCTAAAVREALHGSEQQAAEGSGTSGVFDLAAGLVAALHAAAGPGSHAVLGSAVARPLVALLLPEVRGGDAPPAASSLLAALLKSFPEHAAADAAGAAAAPAAAAAGVGAAGSVAATTHEFAALRLHQSATFTIDSVLRRLAEGQEQPEAAAASCNLLLSCMPQVHHPARKLGEVLQQLVLQQQLAAAVLLLQHLVSGQHADLAAVAAASGELDKAAGAALGTPGTRLPAADGSLAQLLVLLLGGGSSETSLLSAAAQAAALGRLLEQLNEALAVQAGSKIGTAELAELPLEVLQRVLLSPGLHASPSSDIQALRLQLAAVAFGLLVSESAAEAVEAEAAAAGGDSSDEHAASTFLDESDAESVEVVLQPGAVCAAARQLWRQSAAMGSLIARAPADQQAALLQAAQVAVGSTLAAHPLPAAAAAAADATALLLAALGHDSDLGQQLLQALLLGQQGAAMSDEAAAGSSRAAAPTTSLYSAAQAGFLTAVGAAAGFEVLLPGESPAAGGAAVELLAALQGEEGAWEEQHRRQLLQHAASPAGAALLQPALQAAAAAAPGSPRHAAVLCALLRAAVDAGAASTAAAAGFFAEATAPSSEQQLPPALLCQVLPVVAPAFRASSTLLEQSYLSELSQRLCQQATTAEPVAVAAAAAGRAEQPPALQLLQAAVACFPCQTSAEAAARLPTPAVAVSAGADQQHAAAAAASYLKGDDVWYRQQDGSWVEAELVVVDVTVQPPSYAIHISGSAEGSALRETEASRLRPRQPGSARPPSAAQQQSAAAAAAAAAAEKRAAASAAMPPVGCCTADEQAALLQLLQHQASGLQVATATARAGASAPAATPAVAAAIAELSHSCIAYCGPQLTSQQWALLLEALRAAFAQCSAALAAAAARVAGAVCAAAAEIAVGADMQSPAVALQFFRRLKLKGVLERSDKARREAARVTSSLESELAALDSQLLPPLLPALQAYTRAAAAAGSSRALAQKDWQAAEAAACSDMLQLFVTAGSIAAAAAVSGAPAAAVLAGWMGGEAAGSSQHGSAAAWQLLSQHVAATVRAADRAFLLAAVDRANAGMDATGIDVLGALLALSLPGIAPPAMAAAAFAAILQQPELTASLSAADTVDEDALEEQQQQQAAGGGGSGDAAAALEQVGVRLELAAAVASRPTAGDAAFLSGWALLLAHLLAAPADSHGRRLLAQTLKEGHSLVPSLLDSLLPLLPLDGPGGSSRRDSSGAAAAAAGAPASAAGSSGFASQLAALGPFPGEPAEPGTALAQRQRRFAAQLYAAALQALPASARLWFADLRDRGIAGATERYTSAAVSGQLLAAELAAVTQAASSFGKFDKFSVRASATTREVIAVMEVEDGHLLELVVRLPASMPLRAPELDCRRKVGVSEGRLRKWLLSISAFLRMQNGSVAEAISLWKRNVDKEFEGQEECLICYSIIQPTNGQLPRLGCRTCRKRFHGTCLYKWFKSSSKSNCPHCQSPW